MILDGVQINTWEELEAAIADLPEETKAHLRANFTLVGV